MADFPLRLIPLLIMSNSRHGNGIVTFCQKSRVHLKTVKKNSVNYVQNYRIVDLYAKLWFIVYNSKGDILLLNNENGFTASL